MVLKRWSGALMEWGKYLGYSWYLSIRDLALHMLTLIITFMVILWVSVFLYGTFYYTYMPQVTHERHVHLEFRTDCKEFQMKQQFCSFPSANFTFAKTSQEGILSEGQSYVVTLELDMPESPVNQQHGMFMTKFEMYGHKGKVAQTSRTSMLRYKSTLLTTIETFAVLPALLVGSSEQRQLVEVELFGDYQDNPYIPATGAFVEVQSKRIEIYSAKLRIHARFTGLRYLLFNWPLFSAFVGISINIFFLCIVALLSWYQISPSPVEGDDLLSESGSPDRSVAASDDRQRRVMAMLERERQKEREAVKREYGLTGLPPSSSVPYSLHRRSGSSGPLGSPRNPEDISSTSLSPGMDARSYSTSSSTSEFRTSWDFAPEAVDKDASSSLETVTDRPSRSSSEEQKDEGFDLRQRKGQPASS